jgi:hypothetical protein
MSAQCPPRRAPRYARQRGQAMLLTVLLIGVGVSAVVYNFVAPAKHSIERDRLTAASLARAKEALLGYAAKNPDQPGILPCPDMDNDGTADAPCGVTGATAIGRLPWKTLDLPPLRDGTGECLWYAVSGNFKNSGVSGPAVVNSESTGTLIVNNSAGTPVLSGSNSALAIVFAPGAPLPVQDRTSGTPSECGGNTNAANYLDSQTIGGTPFNNATGGGTNSFVAAAASPGPADLNDRLLPITNDALFSIVEMRVLRELRNALRTYHAFRGYFPSANPFADTTETYACDYLSFRGRPPLHIAAGCPMFADWRTPEELPTWFGPNKWQNLTYYSVSPCRVGPAGPFQAGIDTQCALQGDPKVDGTPVPAVAFTTGRALAAQTRPSTQVPNYLDLVGASNENQNLDANFISPVRSTTNNDRLIVVSP